MSATAFCYTGHTCIAFFIWVPLQRKLFSVNVKLYLAYKKTWNWISILGVWFFKEKMWHWLSEYVACSLIKKISAQNKHVGQFYIARWVSWGIKIITVVSVMGSLFEKFCKRWSCSSYVPHGRKTLAWSWWRFKTVCNLIFYGCSS